MTMPANGAHDSPDLVVEAWGPSALFTRPEMRVERLTYPVMTPTAAVGFLSAIFWKPEFAWRPRRIEVLKPIRTYVERRNETDRLPQWNDVVATGAGVDTARDRTQRSAVCLRDVRYRIRAGIELLPHATKDVAAYRAQFRRRVARGAAFQQPYFGMREHVAYFGEATDVKPIGDSVDLGQMIHSIRFGSPTEYGWFHARLDQGVLEIPALGNDDHPVGITGVPVTRPAAVTT